MSDNPYTVKLDKNIANYTALSPLSFLARARDVYPEYTSIVYGKTSYQWQQTYERCSRLASALSKVGVEKNHTVAIMAPNIPPMFEAHFGVPMCGAVLNAINTRLDAKSVAYILEHSEAKVILADTEYAKTLAAALASLKQPPIVIDIEDPSVSDGERLGTIEYEEFLLSGDAHYHWQLPEDEWDAISLNYTSGTTGNPKGVVYHHRGAYMNAMSNITGWEMADHPRYLWTLPAGVSVCSRGVSGAGIYDAIKNHKVTHLCGAPIVLSMIINTEEVEQHELEYPVKVMTAAAPPPATILQAMENRGFHMTHVYGLTETYGPAVMCAWKNEWDKLPAEKRAELKSRQGVRYQVLEGLAVLDPETMVPVPKDGKTVGEIMFRGNIVMKGYFKNPEETQKAFKGGWFHSGDLAICDPDGYVRITDRSKDVIISGGENISSIEIENILYAHSDILEAAVVAMPHEKWGETPCAFVTLKAGKRLSEEDLITWCRDQMAHFKCPGRVVFTELPKTSTGKIQKFKLREQLPTG